MRMHRDDDGGSATNAGLPVGLVIADAACVCNLSAGSREGVATPRPYPLPRYDLLRPRRTLYAMLHCCPSNQRNSSEGAGMAASSDTTRTIKRRGILAAAGAV